MRLEAANNELRNELKLRNDKLHDYLKESKANEDNLASIKKQFSRIQRDYDKSVKDCEELRIAKIQADEKLEQLQKKTLTEVTGQYSEVIRLKAEVDCLKEEIEKREKSKVELVKESYLMESSAMEEKFSVEIDKLKEKISEQQRIEVRLKSELKFAQSKLVSSGKERERWEETIKGLLASFSKGSGGGNWDLPLKLGLDFFAMGLGE